MASEGHAMYVLLCKDQTLYCGYSNDVEKRVATHNAGKGAKYTKSARRRPVRLLYQENFSDKSSALKAEIAFKKLTRKAKERFLAAHHVNL